MSTEPNLAARFPNASPAFLKLNNGLSIPRAPQPAPVAKSPPETKEKAKNRIRQNSAGLNKTEQAFLDWLKARPEHEEEFNRTLSQSLTFKLGNGVRYTPDFITHDYDANQCLFVEAWEVKGFLRDDANVKLKVAASLYPWIKFHLVTRKKGEWQIQEVLP